MTKKKILILIAALILAGAAPLMAASVDRIARKLAQGSSKMKNRRIAVLPFPNFDGTENKGSVLVSERLTTRLAQDKRFQVVERKLLEKVLKELHFQQSGLVEEESARKLGRVLSVEAIVTGTLVPLPNGQTEVNARLIHTETALVLAAAGELIETEWENDVKEPSAEGQNPDGKMSSFFHSREPAEPNKTASGAANEKSSGPSQLLTNIQGLSLGGLKGLEIYEAPKTFIKGLKMTAKELDEMTVTWNQTSGRSEFSEAAIQFARLRDFYSAAEAWDAMSLSRIYLAEALLKEGRHRESIREAIPVAKKSAKRQLKAHALFLIACASQESERPAVAAELFREIIQEYPFEARLIRASGIRLQMPQYVKR